MDIQTTPQSDNQISDLISKLGDKNGYERQKARMMLVHLGNECIPHLIEALKNSMNEMVRREAARALGEFHLPEVATALSASLLDSEVGVRWTAAESLIQLERISIKPLLQSFIKHFDSPWMREATHHIFHVFRDRKLLEQAELDFYEKLNQQALPGFDLGWTGESAWAAEKAIEALDLKKE